MKKGLLLALAMTLSGCLGMPERVEPVSPFDPQRYAGRWYEIARLDHSFERNLSKVTAEYSPRADGGITVLNRGFDTEEQRWKEAEGKAYSVDSPDVGHLKVSFFGPFYSSYVVFELGDNYDYAFVSGYNLNYLWLLSRTPSVSDQVKAEFEAKAGELGFNLGELIYLEHGKQ